MLNPKTIEIIKSTTPLVAATGTKLTAHFYDRMFTHNPELKDVFNMSNQRNGDQREALFNAICGYASNIENIEALLPVVEKIAQKHTSFLISKEQYQIVGSHLLATIDELLAPSQEVLDAWGEAYGLLANIFINREQQIYSGNEEKQGGWKGRREFKLVNKTKESKSITSFVFQPSDGGSVQAFKPGQYLGIYLDSIDFENREIRQYSLSSAVRENEYRISVKREDGGRASSFLHDKVEVGDTVNLVPPAGDFFLEAQSKTPVTLISAGVGLTPTLSMLESLTEHDSQVTWLHATENKKQHAFASHIKGLEEKNPHIQAYTWYNAPESTDIINEDFDFSGLLDLKEIKDKLKIKESHYYFCGPVGFMQFIAKQLLELGVPESQCHYECFGPHKVI